MNVFNDAANDFVVVLGFPKYRVNSRGVVESLRSRAEGEQIWRRLREQKVNGYSAVTLCGPGGKRKLALISRLVMHAFVGPCPSGMEVCHNNGVRGDNRLENLRYDTRKNNHADKKLHNTEQIGVRNGFHKLDDEKVRQIRVLYQQKESVSFIARCMKISRAAVRNVVNKRTWKHVA